jgi:pyruvate dehydrogenase (quinone)
MISFFKPFFPVPPLLSPPSSPPVSLVLIQKDFAHFIRQAVERTANIPFGMELKNPNFAKVAEARGAKGIRIEDPAQVREGLTEALAYKQGPVVVDAVVDPYALAMPSHAPLHTAGGFTLSFAKQVFEGKLDSVITTIDRNIGIV